MANRDETGGRCERCQVLGAPYITRTHTPPRYRDDMDPHHVIKGRQCVRCHTGKCAATLEHVATRCKNPRTQGSAVCVGCEKRIKNVMQNTLHRYGISL